MIYAPHGPFKISVVFSLDADKGLIAEATCDCPIGSLPTEEDIATLAKNAIESVREQFPKAEWPSRDSFLEEELAKKTFGVRVAIPNQGLAFEHKAFSK